MAILSAIITAALGAAASAGVAYATQPDVPNAAKQSRKTVLAALKALPGQRQVEAAARLGQKVQYDADNWLSPKQALQQGFITEDVYRQLKHKESKLEDDGLFEGGPFGGKKGYWALSDIIAPGSSLGYLAESPLRASDGRIKINVKKRNADFTGYGDADIEAKLARAMAQTGLDLQNKYGADFAAESRRQTELADPEGTAARRLLAEKINAEEQARRTRERPVAGALDASVLGDLNLGSDPDSGMRDILARTLERRGDSSLTTADVAGDMSTGLKGEERMRERLQKGMSYLGSGTTPQDAAFRDEQQSMANMAAFLGGRTPQSQFASLSGGGQGAAPMPQAGALPGVDPNLMNNANQAGAAGYSAGVRSLTNNVSPYFMGLSALLNGASVAGKAGFGKN